MKCYVIVILLAISLALLGGVAYAVTLTPQTITTDGLVITPVAATNTEYEFSNLGREFIYINNASASTLNYTVTIPGTVSGYELEDITGTVGSGVTVYVGPFNPTFANAADGNVDFTIDITASVTLAVLRLP